MPNLLFWNIAKNVRPGVVANLAREKDVDILVLAEAEQSPSIYIDKLNQGTDRLYFSDENNNSRLVILTRFRFDKQSMVRDRSEVAIRQYQLPLGDCFLLVAVHLSSKLYNSSEDQALLVTRLSKDIREAETERGHSRTIILGDLNMNPFETGLVGSECLHAISDKRIVSTVDRVVKGERRAFFYNPMWGTFGDHDNTPPGTYFFNRTGVVNFYWNIFDQVLIRPSLLDAFRGVSVIHEVNGVSLLDEHGRPNHKDYSDHLPVLAKFSTIKDSVNV
jgi:hypothetical protein